MPGYFYYTFETVISGMGSGFSFDNLSYTETDYGWQRALPYFNISIGVLPDNTIRVSEYTERGLYVDWDGLMVYTIHDGGYIAE